MKRLVPIPIVLAAAAAFLASSLPAFSADSGTVNAQVTVQNACITLDQSNLNYGAQSFVQPGPIPTFPLPLVVTNCGGQAKLFGRGTNATQFLSGSITWTLDDNVTTHPCTLGPNRFSFVLNDGPAATWGVGLSTVDKQLLGNASLAAGATTTVFNTLKMPCAGSAGAGTIMTWNIVYTATL